MLCSPFIQCFDSFLAILKSFPVFLSLLLIISLVKFLHSFDLLTWRKMKFHEFFSLVMESMPAWKSFRKKGRMESKENKQMNWNQDSTGQMGEKNLYKVWFFFLLLKIQHKINYKCVHSEATTWKCKRAFSTAYMDIFICCHEYL